MLFLSREIPLMVGRIKGKARLVLADRQISGPFHFPRVEKSGILVWGKSDNAKNRHPKLQGRDWQDHHGN